MACIHQTILPRTRLYSKFAIVMLSGDVFFEPRKKCPELLKFGIDPHTIEQA